MDLGEIEKGNGTDSSKKENKGMVHEFPLRSLSVDGNARSALYKKQYSYERQNSINNSKDYNNLKDRKDLDRLNGRSTLEILNDIAGTDKTSEDALKDITGSAVYHVNETSVASISQKLLEKDINLTKDSKMTDPEYNWKGTELMGTECSEKHTDNGRQNRPSRACLYRMTGCCIALLVCCIGLLLFVFIKISNESEAIDEEEALVTGMQALRNHDVNIAGSFKINQTHLHHFQQVKWLGDKNSDIVPSKMDDDCLRIPKAGKYLVFSRFTFNILPSVETLSITHYFKLLTGDGKLKDGGYKRKYVSVLENKLRTSNDIKSNRELRKPSVFIEFFTLDDNDQVCPNVSNPDLLYQSKMDNDVNIIQV